MVRVYRLVILLALVVTHEFASLAHAGIGDPQLATNHPWYSGELTCSDFERLAENQAEIYERVVGERPTTDEQRVLASWLWRNTHYWHGEEGVQDLWGQGFQNNTDTATRDYWTGLHAYGFSLCGTTHAQWSAEMESLLGHNRARVVGVSGHNSFEVFLKAGLYGTGRWALLDHDVSTVIFDEQGKRLLSIAEIKADVRKFTARNTPAGKQRGWLVCGLHAGDGGAFDSFRSAEYLAGYAGPPPMIHLRRGETLRRYFEPGLEDGQTFVYWGRNYNTAGIPGPERSRTWVNQPENMYGSRNGTAHRDGQARFANAVFTYRPDFKSDNYREGIVDESDEHVTLEFISPYIIGATPRAAGPWGIYEHGCRNGLVVSTATPVPVSLSVDRGRTWFEVGKVEGSQDLTDFAKGQRQYQLRLEMGPKLLRDAEVKIVTVCQANSSILPRLKDDGTRVTFAASGRAVVSAGPTLAQAETHRVAGAFDSPRVTMQLAAPRNRPATGVHVVAQVASSNPPSPDVVYQIDYSTDGQAWQPLVKDWRITRQGQEPDDFWSQSFCWGSQQLPNIEGPVQVRFSNNGGKRYRRAEVHLIYSPPRQDTTRVTYRWQDEAGTSAAHHDFPFQPADAKPMTWEVPTGKNVKTLWVQYEPIAD